MSDVINYNGADKWKQRATELLNQGGGGGGTDDYEELNNLPQINSTTLIGDLSLNDLFYDWYNIGSNYFLLADGDPSQATDQNPVYEVGFTSDSKASLMFFKDLSGGYGEFEYLDFERLHNLLQLSNNYNDLSNKPSVNGYLMQDNVTLPYSSFSDKPSINGVTLSGTLSLSDLGIPETYNNLNNKPSINNVTLSGNKTLADLGIVEFANTYSITSASFTLYSGDLDDATAQNPIYSIGFDATSDVSLIFSKYEDPTSGSSVWLTMDDVVKLRRWYEYCENGWDIYPEMWSGAQPTDAETDILLEAPIDETDPTQGVHQMRYSTNGIKYSTRIGGAITNVFSIGRSEIQALENVTGNIQTQLNGKSDTSHTHDDRYYTETEIDTALAGKSNTNHTHDDRYYTESEVNTLLAGKSDTSHTHNSIKDVGNATNTTFAYSKAGLGLSDFTWLACWNGYELRGVNKSNFITTANIGSQTVSTAGTCTGNAATATNASKLNGYASDTSATANTIARRQGNGYLYAVYFNMTNGGRQNPASYTAYPAFVSSDGYLRQSTLDNFKAWLGFKEGTTYTGHIVTWNSGVLCSSGIAASTINEKVGSYASGTSWEKVNYFLKFYGSATALLQNAGGSNFIWTISSWSDARIKKNIKDTDVIGLEKINAIRIRQFDFKDEARGTHKEIGYVAQELQEVVPDCVINVPDEEFEDGLLYVEDKPLIPYIVKAIQELSTKVESLEKEMEELRNGRKNN